MRVNDFSRKVMMGVIAGLFLSITMGTGPVWAGQVLSPTKRVYSSPTPTTTTSTATTPNPSVINASPNPLAVVTGAPSVGLTLSGRYLDRITKCAVVRNGRPVSGATASLSAGTAASRPVKIQAAGGTVTGDAQLRLYAGTTIFDVPLSALRVSIQAPRPAPTPAPNVTTTSPQTAPNVVRAPPSTAPNISSYSPSGPYGSVGTTISFNGRDFEPDFFVAMVGSQILNITYRSASRIDAVLPATRMTGDLKVGYGTAATTMILKTGYFVTGDPIIQDVQPRTFKKGDIVTVTGTDLFSLHPFQPYENYGDFLLRVSNDASPQWQDPYRRNVIYETLYDFIRVSPFSVSPDGGRLSFQVLDAWEQYLEVVEHPPTRDRPQGNRTQVLKYRPLNPQPSSLTGQLRMLPPRGIGGWTVAGPSVTWMPATLSLTSVTPPTWGGQPADFVVVNSNTSTRLDGSAWSSMVQFTGTDLFGAKIMMHGEELMRRSINPDGFGGFVEPQYTNTTDYVTFVKNGASARSPNVLKIVPAPRVLDPSAIPSPLPLNTDIVINGYDLKTTTIPGLTYEFRMSGLPLPGCRLDLQVLSHTSNQIRFRINTTAPIPEYCSDVNLFSSSGSIMSIVLKYNGQERDYWNHRYHLAMP